MMLHPSQMCCFGTSWSNVNVLEINMWTLFHNVDLCCLGNIFWFFVCKFFTAKILVISKKDTWEVSILFLSCSHICHIFHLLCTIYYIFGWNNIDLKCGFAFTARNVKQVVGFLSGMDPTKSCQCAKLNYFRIKIGVLQNFCNSPGLCWVQSGRFYTRWFN